MLLQLLAVIFFGLVAIWFGLRVFLTHSMVRSALALLGSMAALGMLFMALEAEFLGVLQLMMMATEMTVMAVFMVMFMMDPGGLGQMEMTHQKRFSLVVGGLGGVSAAVLPFLVNWGVVAEVAPDPTKQVHDLGIELMSRSMLIFETAGVTILVAMIGAIMLATPRRKEAGHATRSNPGSPVGDHSDSTLEHNIDWPVHAEHHRHHHEVNQPEKTSNNNAEEEKVAQKGKEPA